MDEKELHPVVAATGTKPLQTFSTANPIWMCLILFIIAVIIRFIDNFILEMDIRIGELFITKSLGFVMVLVWLYISGRRVQDIGLNSTNLGLSLIIGTLSTTIAFILGYGIEILLATVQGIHPTVQLSAIDSKMGVTGGILFPLFLVFANCINSFMEEGLFRGVMGRLARIRFSFWQTNWFQACLFGIWHLPWVLRYYQLGDIQTGGELVLSIFFNSVPQLFIGVVYGYFYLKTGSLWSSWAAHTLSNTVLNLVHVTTTSGLDTGIPVRMGVNLIVMLLSMIWVRYVTNKQKIPGEKPWE
jgi:membrane protease YdiL (CAAX protease family)